MSGNGPQPPRRTGGSAGVMRTLKREILAGGYDYNEKLPSERDLAERFDVPLLEHTLP